MYLFRYPRCYTTDRLSGFDVAITDIRDLIKLLNPIHIELLSVFSRLHTQMKRVNNIACFDSSTSFCEAITVYTMKA